MKFMLCPNPYRNGGVSRVVVLSVNEDGEYATVLNVDALSENPSLLRPFGKNYAAAGRFWQVIATVIMFLGVGLSFIWLWWVFIPGLIIAVLLFSANRAGIAENAVSVLLENPEALRYFADRNLVWQARVGSLIEV